MSQAISPLALFRLSVLGPLASRDQLSRGELKAIIKDLANKTYCIPGTKRIHVSSKTIENWYYAWKQQGIEALAAKPRCDKSKSQLAEPVKTALLELKKANPARSINTLITLIEQQGLVQRGSLARTSVHRYLKNLNLSKRTLADAETIERRSFVAKYANDIWHGDVMHAIKVQTPTGLRKTYLVSFMDDASRGIMHSAFCFGETALEVEGVLKQAIMRRGLPKRIILDNGSAYRSHSLQSICATLGIQLIYCPAYEPQGKGKIERYHRTFREAFLNELDINAVKNIGDLNARLWAWIEQIYHQRAHSGLEQETPIHRWRQDLIQLRTLDSGANIDEIFYHRYPRTVRKDGTLQWEGERFEVPYEFAGEAVILVVDPQTQQAIRIESKTGKVLGAVVLLDLEENTHRKRQRPTLASIPKEHQPSPNIVEMALEAYNKTWELTNLDKEND